MPDAVFSSPNSKVEAKPWTYPDGVATISCLFVGFRAVVTAANAFCGDAPFTVKPLPVAVASLNTLFAAGTSDKIENLRNPSPVPAAGLITCSSQVSTSALEKLMDSLYLSPLEVLVILYKSGLFVYCFPCRSGIMRSETELFI